MIKLAVSGCRGRMGSAISKLASQQPALFQLTTLLEHKNHPEAKGKLYGVPITTDNTNLKGCGALIEFTLPEGTLENLKACVNYSIPMVIGTTGFNPAQIKEIETASKRIPIVFASNMSIGVNVLFKLIEIAAEKIGTAAIDIEETHHVHKKDAPSGTAKTMGEIAEKFSKQKISPIKSFRKGEVIGDHTIVFDTKEDILTITHHAKDRSMFAKGALEAALFLIGKKPGLYDMQDVLGLS